MKKVIRQGLIYDGTGTEPYCADVLIEGSRIVRIAPDIEADGALEIMARGKAVSPGFVDIHRHCDFAVLRDPLFGCAELAQGITSVVGGNCGLSAVPANPQTAVQSAALLAPCLGAMRDEPFETFDAYMEALRKQPLRVNMGMLSALGAIRICVKGFEKSPFTPRQMDRAKALVREAMEGGALGLSMGIMYTPECYNSREEYISMLSAAAPYGRPVSCHIRGEGDSLARSVAEVIDLGMQAGVPVNISHFKCTGVRNWKRGIFEAIGEIERARARGFNVTADFYPYTAGATTLLSLLPPCVLEEDNDRLWDKLGTRGGVEQVRKALGRPHPGWDDMIDMIGWQRIRISGTALPDAAQYTGKNLEEAAQMLGLEGPVEALCCLLSRTRGETGVVLQSMDPEDVDTVARLPYTLVISDALYGEGATHPRLCGAFARVLRDMVRERGVLTLPQAIRKMTLLPAERLGLTDRGRLAAGMTADIAVFDPQRIADRATYAEPRLLSEGMDCVLVAGEQAWHGDNRDDRAYSARVLQAR